MMFRYRVSAMVIFIANILEPGDSSRILCVFPAPFVSHQGVYRGLALALNKRGHQLVVVTPNPINDPTLTNYTEIDVSLDYEILAEVKSIENRRKLKWIDWSKIVHACFSDLMDGILGHPDLRKLYAPDSNERFDLLIVEFSHWQSVYPLAIRFGVPMIGIISMGLTQNNLYTIGNPIIPSHPANWELETDVFEQATFWQRLKNFITAWEYVYWYQTSHVAEQEAVAKKHFGNDIPDLNDLEKNVSLIFVNQAAPISYARPNIPKIIEIGGFHISKQNITLPKVFSYIPNDFQSRPHVVVANCEEAKFAGLGKILDAATEGFVYMSLGSHTKSTTLPEQTKNKFISAFSRLPYKVLWKFEDDFLSNKPDNVHIMKWIPQQAVLAHPNLKVFVYQGGLQSTEEAVHHAVPLVGLPIMFDQDMQVNKMVSLGVAKRLEISAIDEDELFEAISTVATDASYKQKMLDLRSLINDKPLDPLENAVWWTEHVIRHKGAPHLHYAAADEAWYTHQDMDVITFISASSVIILSLSLVVLYRIVKSIHNISSDAKILNEKKIN